MCCRLLQGGVRPWRFGGALLAGCGVWWEVGGGGDGDGAVGSGSGDRTVRV
jgi:hypothetical protein